MPPIFSLLARLAVAAIWLQQGLWIKVIQLDPEHLSILQALGGPIPAEIALRGIGLGETLIAIAVLIRWFPLPMALFQLAILVSMNTIGVLWGGAPPDILIHNLPFALCVAITGAAVRPRGSAQEAWAEGALGRGGEAAPIFGQVREDERVELALIEGLGRPARALSIASGGDTAMSLLAAEPPPSSLTMIDINPAQLRVVALKEAMLRTLEPADLRSALESDARPAWPQLEAALDPADADWWRSRQALLSEGVARCGIVDRGLARAAGVFRALVLRRGAFEALLDAPDLEQQRAAFTSRWRTWRWGAVFRLGLHPAVLRGIYGPIFLRELPPDFAARMREHAEQALTRHPIAENAPLWQALAGRYPPDDEALPTWARPSSRARILAGLERSQRVHGDALDHLQRAAPDSLDFVGLSNVMEVSDAAYRRRLLAAAARALAPGGVVIARSIYAPLPEPVVLADRRLELDREASAALEAQERSPFCRHIAVLRVVALDATSEEARRAP